MSLQMIDIPNLTEIEPGIWTGGQPSAEQLERAREAGLAGVISLCPETETGWDEQATAEALGIVFSSVPVGAACDVTEAAARTLHAALESMPRPVLVHCGSGNRVGALFALVAHLFEGQSCEAAIALGRKAGLASLESTVRPMLGAH